MLRKVLDSAWFYFTLAGILLVVAVISQFEIRLPSRPKGDVEDIRALKDRDDLNVIFILIDTLRADHLGMYGYERDTSPIMDELASSGIRFAHVQSQSSWTKSSMASMWSSLYPRRVGIMQYDDTIAQDVLMPAEVFRKAGLRTGAVYRNGWVDANFGFDQGFEMYLKPRPSMTPAKFERGARTSNPLMGTDFDTTEAALEFLRSNAHERFFLYLHYMDVHQYLYDDSTALFGTSFLDSYDNAIRWVDLNVSGIAGELQDRDLLERTIIIIASDHGEAFREHGFEGHARNLYREVTETPLIMILPMRLDPGIVVDTPVRNIDIWPTVYDIMGIEGPPDIDGVSMLPAIEAAGKMAAVSAPDPRPSFSELDEHWGRGEGNRVVVSVVDGQFRMIRRGFGERATELYDRADDPKEQRDVSDAHPEMREELAEKVDAYLESGPVWTSEPVELDEMRKNQLRALGYVLE